MLVVSRKPGQSITFPSLGVTVHITAASKGSVRVGVDAPPDVRVLRAELASPADPAAAPSGAEHTRSNALNKATLAVHLARKQWAAGRPADADASLGTALTALEALSGSPPARPACRALVVEDDDNERELLAGLLGLSGCECATAADGEAALAYLAAGGRPDVVLLDMAMPRCDGPATLRCIRADERFAGLRVFSVSGTPPAAVDLPLGPGGFDGWFPKPLNPQRLLDAIRAARAPSAN